jgi:hypothetical protein
MTKPIATLAASLIFSSLLRSRLSLAAEKVAISLPEGRYLGNDLIDSITSVYRASGVYSDTKSTSAKRSVD